ncbi:DUF4270 domain-containing protein [Pedobacter sp. BMA]|uniref:DUF4270 domain-containing protein n=1 Tax=Pedobacter sp. BMA TaxID=1663685 RepID=UPI00064A5DB4|nr:DUF4270 domain-containing protein [Pedobacter sp. BMA]KLT64952.1 hypothetical protein AB669_14640 [Pedobacter sp. BMA]
MKFTKQDLLTLLISLFLFASCKNPDGVGLDIDSNTAITGNLVVSNVTTQIVKEADISTIALARYPIGYMNDPVFGKTEASIAMTVAPPTTLAQDFGTSPTLDSAVLVLSLPTTDAVTKFYGDTTSSIYSVDIYQLTNNITKYKNSDVQAHNSQLLGNFRGKINPNTPVKIYDIVTAAADTIKNMPAQLRIPLNKAFIQQQIMNLAITNFTTNAKFANIFKGLYAQINKTTSSGTGGIAFIDFSSSTSYLQLVYKHTNTSSGIDTTSVNFPIGTSSTALPITATISHDYTGTPVQTQLLAPTAEYQTTYLQGLVGVKTKIKFPDLAKFNSTYGKSVVNKADLIIELGSGTSVYPFLAAQRLSLYRWDLAEQPANISDYTSYVANSTPALFGGYFDSINNRYIFNVTNYVQTLIDGTIEDNGTFLAPTSYTLFETTPTATSAERAIIGAKTTTTNKIKLNIYYTKIN